MYHATIADGTPRAEREDLGLAELSTRRLAAKLGVRSPTLYWHVKNKAELLDLVAEAICADAFHIDATAPWREQLASGLRQFRALLLAHRDAAALPRERPPGPARVGPAFGRLSDADLFELGVEVILDGLEQRLLR